MSIGSKGKQKSPTSGDFHAFVTNVFLVEVGYKTKINTGLPDGFAVLRITQIPIGDKATEDLRRQKSPPARPGDNYRKPLIFTKAAKKLRPVFEGAPDVRDTSGPVRIGPVDGWWEMDCGLKTQRCPDPRQSPLCVPWHIGLAKQAVEVEESEDLIQLVPNPLFQSPKGIVLVVTDGQCSGLLDGVNRSRGEADGLVEPDHVRFLQTDHVQQISVDSADKEIHRGYAIFDCFQNPGMRPVRRKVKRENFLVESSKAAQSIPRGLY